MLLRLLKYKHTIKFPYLDRFYNVYTRVVAPMAMLVNNTILNNVFKLSSLTDVLYRILAPISQTN